MVKHQNMIKYGTIIFEHGRRDGGRTQKLPRRVCSVSHDNKMMVQYLKSRPLVSTKTGESHFAKISLLISSIILLIRST